jgi:DNA-binding NarL/FixJ family response regulator
MFAAYTKIEDNQDNQMKLPKRVILWGESNLLLVGIETFLKEKKGWEVIRITKTQENEEFIRLVKRKKPTTVILGGLDCKASLELSTLLLAAVPELRVITLKLDDNVAEVFERQEVQVKEAADLLSLIDCP